MNDWLADADQWYPEDAIAIALGRLLYSATHLEAMVEDVLGALVNADDPVVGEMIGFQVSVGALLDRCQWLGDHYFFEEDEALLHRLNRWVGHTRKALRKRNEVVHSEWYLDLLGWSPDDPVIEHGQMGYRRKAKALQFDSWTVDEAHIRDAAEACRAAFKEGSAVYRAVSARRMPPEPI